MDKTDKTQDVPGQEQEPSDDASTEPAAPAVGGQAEASNTPPAGIPAGSGVSDIYETQRLPDVKKIVLSAPRHLVYGHSRDIGMVRQNNEDSTFTFFASQQNVENAPDVGIFIVADGAGGHEEGERASAIASRVVATHLSQYLYQAMLSPRLGEPVEHPPIAELMAEAVRLADKAVRQDVPKGGTTLTTVLLVGDLAHIAHVGDSRAYLISAGDDTSGPSMEQLTRDHSVARRLEEIGQITAQEASVHPEASRLWKMVGLTENLEPDINTRRLPPGSYLLICSDGLWNMVPEELIMRTVLEAKTPQEAADRLIAQANAHGGADNIAAIVVQMPE